MIFFQFINSEKKLLGVIGILCLIITFYAFQALPISFLGLTLLLIGIAFMIGEVSTPGFGIAGTCGIFVFIIGSILILDMNAPGYYLKPVILLLISVAMASLFFLTLLFGIKRNLRQP